VIGLNPIFPTNVELYLGEVGTYRPCRGEKTYTLRRNEEETYGEKAPEVYANTQSR